MTTVYQRRPERRYPLSLSSSSGKVAEIRKEHDKRLTRRSMDEPLTKSREHFLPDTAILSREHIGFSRDKTDSLPGYSLGTKKRSTRRGTGSHGEIVTDTRRMSTLTQSSSCQESDTSEKDKKLRTSQVKQLRRQHTKQLYNKFILVAKVAVFCAKLGKSYILRNKVYDEIAPYINSLHFYDYGAPVEGVDLLFDPSKFKADKQLRLSEEAIRILSMPSPERTERELYYAQLALRNNKAFSDYPMRMQRKIVQVGFYEKYEAKRVIVRQGYPAHSFYFILSGSIVVMVSENNTKVAKPVAYLSKGATFGELAIINRTNRQATVVAKSTLELLSIDIESFHKIFMAGGVKNIHDPDHNVFMHALSFLKGWPIEILSDEPTKCIFHYFKRGEIMVKDTNYSDWLFIVKSGSVQVLKKLKRVDPYEWLKKENIKGQKHKHGNDIRGEKDLREKQRRFVLPEIRIPKKSPGDVEDPEVESGRMIHTPPCEIDSVREANSPVTIVVPSASVTDSNDTTNGRDLSAISSEGTNSNRAQSSSRNQRRSRADRRDSSPSALTATPAVTSVKTYDDVTERHRKGLKSSKKRGPEKKKKRKSNKAKDEVEFEQEVKRKQEIRTINDDFDSKFRMKTTWNYNNDELTDADIDPQFVNVQTLVKGQVFGIAQTLLGKQPSFCVVSSGAECIMIDKLFYLRHAPDELLRKIRNECCPYPSDEDMQEELQTTIDWHAYKHSTFKNTLKYLSIKNSPRKIPS